MSETQTYLLSNLNKLIHCGLTAEVQRVMCSIGNLKRPFDSHMKQQLMRYLELIIPLNSLNLNVSSAKTSHCVNFLVGGLGIGTVLCVFSLISSCEKPPTSIDFIVRC